MEDILRPFELTAGMCHMHWLTPFVVYWRGGRSRRSCSHADASGEWLSHPLPHGGR